MQTPPFRSVALLPSAVAWREPVDDPPPAGPEGATRLRLGEMDPHLHCSVIGTCLSTSELRKLMGKHIDVDGASDLVVHHEAVRLASQSVEVARALNKSLDRRHEREVERFARAKDATSLGELWKQSLKSGEVPGAYWAVLTHRRTTPDLRQQVFGDVHMLSHLVGAANRADIRRLVALEQENSELRDRTERHQQRLNDLVGERERIGEERDALRIRLADLERVVDSGVDDSRIASEAAAATRTLSSTVALHTRRREAAEAQAAALQGEVERLQQELQHLRANVAELGRELGAAEAELRDASEPDRSASVVHTRLEGQHVLYVGGRPSSNPAIRDLVLRHGGAYQRHDGGLEDRKGLLASALAWADLVVFPVDCIDHDSALSLKQSCLRQGTPFVPLRSASVSSFVAALSALAQPPSNHGPTCDGPCLKHS